MRISIRYIDGVKTTYYDLDPLGSADAGGTVATSTTLELVEDFGLYCTPRVMRFDDADNWHLPSAATGGTPDFVETKPYEPCYRLCTWDELADALTIDVDGVLFATKQGDQLVPVYGGAGAVPYDGMAADFHTEHHPTGEAQPTAQAAPGCDYGLGG